ncbi:MAG: alpha-methylacyl-CoA racemase, partial [Acidimicrobiaceae bacterium]|nr:alpha-methylacyl-CoA racemase [Acidimicrobiaceae bacterium]
MPGPLAGYRIVELAGIGPAPFGAMMLADMGAEVIRVDRPDAVASIEGAQPDGSWDLLNRGRRSVAIDLKHPDGVATVLSLVARADALVEGFRPGVAERLGVGPKPCLARNPRL